MNPSDLATIVEHFGRIIKAQIRIYAMKAENDYRLSINEAIAYRESDFLYYTNEVDSSIQYLKEWG